nr:hypothetical protein [Streptomyces lienomycini]
MVELDGGLGDVGVLGEGGFDFCGFDAVAAYFELVVGAAEVFEVAVGVPAGEVAGAVHAPAGGAVGVGGEAVGGEGGLVEVAAGESGGVGVELAGGARGYGLEGVVQEVDADVVDGPAQGWGEGPGVGVGGQGVGGEDLCFGGAVVVVEGAGGVPVEAAGAGAGGEGFSGLGDVPQVGQWLVGVEGGVGDGFEHGVGGEEFVDAVLGEPGGEGFHVAAGVLVGDHEGLARQEGGQDFLDRHVETDRGELRGPGPRAPAELVVVPAQHVHHAQPCHLHRLGPARRPGRVDHIRRTQQPQHPRPLRSGGIGLRARVDQCRRLRIVQGQERGCLRPRQVLCDVLAGEAEGGAGVVEHEPDTRGGMAGVQGQVRGTGFEDREDRDDLRG